MLQRKRAEGIAKLGSRVRIPSPAPNFPKKIRALYPRLRRESWGSRGKQPEAKRYGLSAAVPVLSAARLRTSVCRTRHAWRRQPCLRWAADVQPGAVTVGAEPPLA